MKRKAAKLDQQQSNKGKQSSKRNDSGQKQAASNVHKNTNRSFHRAIGNQAIQQLYRNGHLQAKLSVSHSGDENEREAKRVAEQVMGMSATESPFDPGDTEGINRRGSSDKAAIDDEREQQIKSVTSGGKPLPPATRSFFEPRFGRDFVDVRIHTGSKADEAARSINADAFTYGNDIVFRRGKYDPKSKDGKKLLAHELTHTLQQEDSPKTIQRQEPPEQKRENQQQKGQQSKVKSKIGVDPYLRGEKTSPPQPQTLNPDGRFTKELLLFLGKNYKPKAAKYALDLLEQSSTFTKAAAFLNKKYKSMDKNVEIEASDRSRTKLEKKGTDKIEVMMSKEGQQFTDVTSGFGMDEKDKIQYSVQELIHETAHAYRKYKKKKHATSEGLRSFLIDEKRTRELEQRIINQIGKAKFHDPGIKSIQKIAFDKVSGENITYLDKYYIDRARKKVKENFTNLKERPESVPLVAPKKFFVDVVTSKVSTLRDIATFKPIPDFYKEKNEEIKKKLLKKIEKIKAKIESRRSQRSESSGTQSRSNLHRQIANELLGISQRHADMLGISK